MVSGQPLAAIDECLDRGVLIMDGDTVGFRHDLTEQLARARDSKLEALAIYEREQDARSIGAAQRWLSRLSWVLGQNADSERYAAAAVTTLESVGPGPELAMAYSNLARAARGRQ